MKGIEKSNKMNGLCQRCHERSKILIHHRNGNHDNDVPSNREGLCYRCHLVVHGRADIGIGVRNDRLPIDWKPEPLDFGEVRRQYLSFFPRA